LSGLRFLDIINLKTNYDQDETFNLTISLRDMYNVPIVGKSVNYSIINQDGYSYVDTSSITDVSGEFEINIALILSGMRAIII